MLTLALAIGANTAIFTVADVVLFKRLPYAHPDRLFVLESRDTTTGETSRGVPLRYLRAIEDAPALGTVGLRGPTVMTIHRGDEAEWTETVAVEPEYFRVLGVRPARGRLFDAQDTQAAGQTALLTYDAWRRRFGGDEQIVGRTVRLGTQSREVIGVLPRGFVIPTTSLRFMYNATGRPDYVTVLPPEAAGNPERRFEHAVIRLEGAQTRALAQARIDAVVAAVRRTPGEQVVLENPRAVLFPAGRPVLALLVGAAACVMLIACSNLASLLLARTRRREREIAVHAALGATRLRIIRPLLLETMLIGLAGAAVALLLTSTTFAVLLRQIPPAVYGSADVDVGLRVIAFGAALGILSGIVFAVVPAWRAASFDVQALTRRRAGRTALRRTWLPHPTIAVQVATSIVLVFGAAVASRALVSVLRIPLGFSATNLAAINVRPAGPQPVDLRAFYVGVVAHLAQRADVLAAGAGGSIPLDGFGAADAVQPPAGSTVDVLHALPGYFETVGMRPVRGRLLTGADVAGAAVAVASESAARRLVPDGDPVGARVRTKSGAEYTIVGIVADVQRSVARTMDPPIYVVPPADTTRGMTIVVRTRQRNAGTLATVRRAVATLAPAAPVSAVWWSDVIDALTAYRSPRFQTLLLGGFATLALGIVAMGIFAGVTSAVVSRTREMGIRLALGADPRRLMHVLLGQAVAPVGVGVICGIAAAQLLKGLVEARLSQVDARDPAMLFVSALVVCTVALAAGYIPARQARCVDPVEILRAE
ncbi:MAG TPA: ABC transporter permease [Longimicrobiales bacterium]